MYSRLSWTVVLFVLLTLSNLALAETPDANRILEDSWEHNVFDLDQAQAEVKMVLLEKKTEVVEERTMRVKAMRSEGLSRYIMHFLKPEDVAGTAFLMVEQKDTDDDQWLYLPALKKTLRKGGSNNKTESFMGTQFTYGDMEARDVNDSVNKRLADEKLGGIDCYVIESVAKPEKKEQYSKIITWINKANNAPVRMKFFDLKDSLKKVMMVQKLGTVKSPKTGKNVLVITDAVMLNVQNNEATRLLVGNIDTSVKLANEDFTKERLSKI